MLENLEKKIDRHSVTDKEISRILDKLKDQKINFESFLYQDNLRNYINSYETENFAKSYNITYIFVSLFLELYHMSKDGDEYKQNIEKYKSLLVWVLNKHWLNSKRSIKSTINIFTTNYDTFIEEALEDLNQFYYNGFHGVVNRTFSPEYYDFKYFDDMNLNKNFYQEKKSLFNLYKLHGSLTWKYNDKNNKLEEVSIQPSVEFSNHLIYPHLIYPSTDKYSMSLNYEHYYELQKKFKNCLNKEDSCLLIIGFSLKDNHIWKIIKEALSNGKLIVFIFCSKSILKNNVILKEIVEKEFREGLLNINGINFICMENYNFVDYFREKADFSSQYENTSNVESIEFENDFKGS